MDGKRRLWKRILFLSVAITLVAAVVWYLYQPYLQMGRRAGTVAALNTYGDLLEGFHKEHGQYPRALEEVASELDWFTKEDRWGTPLIYLSDGAFFILVSCAADGSPEGLNYHQARLETPRPAAALDEECRDGDLDLILSDRGWYRPCAK